MLADRGTRDLYELTPDGTFLRKIDVNFPSSIKPSGVTIAPGTTNPALRNYFVSDRHVDNDGEPTENDGRIFEVVVIPLGGNGAPIVDAGPPQTVQWPTSNVEPRRLRERRRPPVPPEQRGGALEQAEWPGVGHVRQPEQRHDDRLLLGAGELRPAARRQRLRTASLDSVAITLSENVTLSLSSVGPGSVLLDPPGGSYAFGQSVNLTALPDPNAAFLGWSGDLGATTNPETLVMNESKSVTASFATLHTLTVEATGAGSVTLSPPGGAYPSGTLVTLSAAPGPNAVFDGWGGALSGNTNPETLLIDGDLAVTASFTQLFSVSDLGGGPGQRVSLSADRPLPVRFDGDGGRSTGRGCRVRRLERRPHGHDQPREPARRRRQEPHRQLRDALRRRHLASGPRHAHARSARRQLPGRHGRERQRHARRERRVRRLRR